MINTSLLELSLNFLFDLANKVSWQKTKKKLKLPARSLCGLRREFENGLWGRLSPRSVVDIVLEITPDQLKIFNRSDTMLPSLLPFRVVRNQL